MLSDDQLSKQLWKFRDRTRKRIEELSSSSNSVESEIEQITRRLEGPMSRQYSQLPDFVQEALFQEPHFTGMAKACEMRIFSGMKL
jgi:hypothetical protein